MAITFLLLIVFPCTEDNINVDSLSYKESPAEHSSCDDDCSPVCTCQCCPSQWIASDEFKIIPTISLISFYPELLAYGSGQFVIGIWDPPKFI